MEETLTMTARKCLNCGEHIGPGRKDRKYCSDSCKSDYNNKLRDEQGSLPKANAADCITTINLILAKNHTILNSLLGDEGKTRIQKRDLDGRGFNFKFITSVAPTNDEENYCFCYELGYKFSEDQKYVIIVRREREVIC